MARLIAPSQVAEWEARLRAAVAKALDPQLALVRSQAVARGVSLTASTTATQRAATGALAGVVFYNLWSDVAWTKALALYLQPEVTAIEAEAALLAGQSVAMDAAFGFAATGVWGALVMGTATGAGAYLGLRLAEAGRSGDPSATLSAVLATAGAIIGGLIGALAEVASNSMATELGQYAAQQNPTQYGSSTRTWNAMDDDRTRDAHADADGQEVGVDEAFDVGGEELMYPGDPAGSDENTLNCRCWLDVTGLAAEDGQPTEAEAA
jgi:hypothetical protein